MAELAGLQPVCRRFESDRLHMNDDEIDADAAAFEAWYEDVKADQANTGHDLDVWVIYDRPADHPAFFVVRRQIATRHGVVHHPAVLLANDLEGARTIVHTLGGKGLYRLDRQPEDDPKIVECWF